MPLGEDPASIYITWCRSQGHGQHPAFPVYSACLPLFLARSPCTTALVITAVCLDTAPMLLGKDPASTDDPRSRSLGHGQHPPFPVSYFSIPSMLRQDIFTHMRADAPQDLIHSLPLSIATLYNAHIVLTTIATDSVLYTRQGCKPTKPGPRRFMDTAP
jgi:hypothetical protein